MSEFRCIIQANSWADQRRDQLEQRLAESHARHYPGETTTVTWVPIPPGQMFTEGRPSTSSIVTSFINHETTLDSRSAYMRDVCDLWTEITNCTDHEVVVAIAETVNASTDSE